MEYKFVKELGEGSYGKVSLVKRGDSFFAKKVINDNIDLLVGVREMNITKTASKLHPYIINILDHEFTTSGHSYEMAQYLDYCSGGCLDKLLDDERDYPNHGIKQPLGNISKRITNLSNIASALHSLHRNGIYHMDIKTENILFRDDDMCLCDFSNCIVKNSWKKDYNPPPNQYQSLIYRSPDIATFRVSWENAEKSDVWAFAIVMLETLGLSGLFQDLENETDRQMSKIKQIINRFIVSDSRVKSKGVTNNKIFTKIFPSDNSGWGLEQDTSQNYGYLWCAILANKIRNINYDTLLSHSTQYFELRKCPISENEMSMLRNIFTNIIPKMLTSNPSKRISMMEVCEMLGAEIHTVSIEPWIPTESFNNNDWLDVYTKTRAELEDVNVSYGQLTMKVPPMVLDYAKAISEATIIKMGGVIKPKNTIKKYRNIYGASFLIACEIFDLMIELTEDNYIVPGKIILSDLSDCLVDVTNATAGILLQLN